MSKQIWLTILGAALLLSAAPVVSGAAHPRAARRLLALNPRREPARQTQTSASKSKAKKRTATSKSVSSTSRRKSTRSKVKAQAVPTSDRVKEIQSALQREGLYDGEPTGKWDDATAEAMRKYQDKNGFNPTGKIDARSLEKLGLGSQTAGKGAPVPTATTAGTAPATPGTGATPAANTAAPPTTATAPPADPPTK